MAGFGVFGKMPGAGDFVQFDLPVAFVQTWDSWLQGGLVAARTQLGDAWAERYNSAPIWRFAIPAGMAGDASMLGVLMPSVDRVGRHFPLTLAAALPGGASHVAALLRTGEVLAHVEDIALETLGGAISPSELQARLSAIGLIAPPPVRQRTFGGTSLVSREGDLSALPDLVAMRMDTAREGLWSAETADASYALAAASLGPDLLGHLIAPSSERSRSGIPA